MYFLYTDGGARGNPGPAATGYYLFDENMQVVDAGGDYLGKATNNVAEYNALISGLKLALTHKVEELECKLDSELVVKQLEGVYRVKEPQLQILNSEAHKLLKKFPKIKITHVPRAQNKLADKKVNDVLDANNVTSSDK